jgi:pimeloyl-ACP methyl ester carboxylesterase
MGIMAHPDIKPIKPRAAAMPAPEAIAMEKENPRKYGNPPYRILLVHGGPGGAGEMAPVARELSPDMGILEPLQTASTLEGQVEELRRQIMENAEVPAGLVGFSWGAWLSLIVAARYPDIVARLVLVGSGGFREEHAEWTQKTRMARLTEAEKKEIVDLGREFAGSDADKARIAFARMGEMVSRADAFEPMPKWPEEIEYRPDIFEGVWKEAAELRRSGRLLDLAGSVRCPVTALHGDYDPHPAEGVSAPLSAVIKSFSFILLEKCGHKPWIEVFARDAFFAHLREELAEAG